MEQKTEFFQETRIPEHIPFECQHGHDNCNLVPCYTPVHVVDGVLRINEDEHCREWVLSNFTPFSNICTECADELCYGDHVTDLMGGGRHMSVNKCWGCNKIFLRDTLICVPFFCTDKSCIEKQSERRNWYRLLVVAGKLEDARKILEDYWEIDIPMSGLEDVIMAGHMDEIFEGMLLEVRSYD